MQGRRLISAPLGRLSRASLAVAPENQICPNLNNIKYTYIINFTQFYKQKDIKVIKIYIAELIELVKQKKY